MRFPQRPPAVRNILADVDPEHEVEIMKAGATTLDDGRYLHWDQLRFRTPPSNLSPAESWASTKLAREHLRAAVPAMEAAYDLPFHYTDLPAIREALHQFDRRNVARAVAEALGDEAALTEYRVRQLVEEAISSSLIEGARPTTRDIARKMVQEQRKPASRDEQMIFNNWSAMQHVLELVAEGRGLRVADLLELHRIIGEGCLDVPGTEGQLRGPEHVVDVSDLEGHVWHTPPPAEGIEDRLQRLLDFAQDSEGPFLHPVLRAIVAHFWLAYEHPFRDGNGRVARALYYWCMLRHGYEMAEFLSISGPIDRNPKLYYMAFAHTETDDFDLTYFVLNQIEVMQRAIRELFDHLARRAERTRRLAALVADVETLNYRQRSLLNHAIRHPLESYTIEGHASSHRVHYLTSRQDLAGLVERGLLVDGGGRPKRFSLSPSFAASLPKG